MPDSTNKERCTGHCCRSFTMPQSPERIWQMYEDWLNLYATNRVIHLNDIHIVAPMLIHLRAVDTDPLSGHKFREPQHEYTCKHLDAATGNCSIYDHRPEMCRDYPGIHGCRYKDCTWESRKARPLEAVMSKVYDKDIAALPLGCESTYAKKGEDK